jgi:hypothetical protein
MDVCGRNATSAMFIFVGVRSNQRWPGQCGEECKCNTSLKVSVSLYCFVIVVDIPTNL